MPMMTHWMMAMTWPMQMSAAFWKAYFDTWSNVMPVPGAIPMGPEVTEAAAAGAAAVAKGTPMGSADARTGGLPSDTGTSGSKLPENDLA